MQRHRGNREFGSYFFQTGKTQGKYFDNDCYYEKYASFGKFQNFCNGTGETENLVPTFSKQGKHRENILIMIVIMKNMLLLVNFKIFCNGTGETENLVPTFSKQGKHRENILIMIVIIKSMLLLVNFKIFWLCFTWHSLNFGLLLQFMPNRHLYYLSPVYLYITSIC